MAQRKFAIGDIVRCVLHESGPLMVVNIASNSRGPFVQLKRLGSESGQWYDCAYYEWDCELDAHPDDGGRASIDEGAAEYDMIMQMQGVLK